MIVYTGSNVKLTPTKYNTKEEILEAYIDIDLHFLVLNTQNYITCTFILEEN